MTDTAEKEHCCISHEFFKVASANPHKIAVIHASGGARICRELREKFLDELGDGRNEEDEFFDGHRISSYPPVYEEDECFTYSEILASVDALSCRIRHILDGGDDPNLISPRGYSDREPTLDGKFSESSKMVKITGDQLTKFQNVDNTPKVVGIYMVPSVEYIIAVLSVLRCGEVFLPLDPSWPQERILSIVSNSNVGFVIKGVSSLDKSNHDHCEKSDCLLDNSCCSLLCISMKQSLHDQSDQLHLGWPCESTNPRTFSYLMYTSGSTGKPKGVCGTEQGLVNRYLWMKELFPLDGEEIFLFKTSISFIDHLQEFLSAILTGVPLVVPPFEELKANPFCIIDFLKVYFVSRITIVPSLIRLILPAIESPQSMRFRRSLKLLVLSGEILPLSLYNMLHNLLPKTSILNLYGSTEVSGDCTYFDCKRLSMVLETEELSTVPIGIPISNCDIVLVGEPNASNEGEIYVGGHCISIGYFHNPTITSLDYVKLPEETVYSCSTFKDSATQLYFRTGDFAKQLRSGDLVFLGRKDRTIKVNGQRVALEEIENTLREHPNVIDAAVISHTDAGKPAYLVAYMVLKVKDEYREGLGSSIGSWLTKKLPAVMIPSHYICIDSLPLLSTGKTNYAFLEELSFSPRQAENDIGVIECDFDPLQAIKKAFCNALMVEKVMDDDDFFLIGGNSITAAQVAYKLGIDMRLLYIFSSASKLRNVLEKEGSYNDNFTIYADWVARPKPDEGKMLHSSDSVDPNLYKSSSHTKPLTILSEKSDDLSVSSKYLKTDSNLYTNSGSLLPQDSQPLFSSFNLPSACSFSRSNKVMCKGEYEINDIGPCWSVEIPRNRKGIMRELWKVQLESCVDASPLIVFREGQMYLFIGSHSQIFLCINAISGFVQWQVKLDGRIECSAAITSDFSQVVVGCYKGKIYFLDFMTGNILWAFQAGGEVSTFIYNHGHALKMLREKCGGDLVRLGITRFATNYIALKSFEAKKPGLRALFASTEWFAWRGSDTPAGRAARETIASEGFWQDVKKVVTLLEPLVKVLRMVDSERKPTLPHLYAAIDMMKRHVHAAIPRGGKRYLQIIQARWEKMLMHPMHKAAYYLNPKYQYRCKLGLVQKLVDAVQVVVAKLEPNSRMQSKCNPEVKSQPIVDKCRNLIWCGSHDHNLYALDYRSHCCVYKTSCGGSVYGSASIDLVHEMLYVASTSGRVTAISIKALPFSIVWNYELGVPVFGSLSISSPSGNVICCLVDGHVIALDPSGSIIWTVVTGGPLFAGPCISYVIPSQVLICSRNGSVYSFELKGGNLLWQYDVGEPITSSAYVDENMQLSDPSYQSDRLACICGSSGSIYLLRINSNATTYWNHPEKELVGPMVQEFALMNLQGDIFSSPVMIGGRIYVGCRDDYVHCIGVEAKVLAKNDG